jgi:hypothetical protein
MTELRGFDLEGETSRAWRGFACRLADHLADMEDGDTLEIGLVGLPAEAPGESSTVVFTGCEDAMLRSLVSVEPVSAGDKATRSISRCDFVDLLATVGWAVRDEAGQGANGEGGGHRRVTADLVLPRREADRFASLTVRLLCEVLGAVHPVFLRISGDRDLVDRSPDGTTIADERDLALPGVTTPVDSAHLRALVSQTIATDLAHEPAVDRDGDIVLPSGSGRVFVRVLESSASVSIFGRLVRDITHPYEAQAVVSRLNAEYSFVKFTYGANAVVAGVHLPASPFVPAQLRRMIATFTELSEHIDDELVTRLGGRYDCEPEAAGSGDDEGDVPDGVPPELLTLLRLDPEGLGLDAEVTAQICGYDVALTRQLLHIACGQEAVWRAAAEEPDEDPQQGARCFDEAAGWKATWNSLARALELISSTTG